MFDVLPQAALALLEPVIPSLPTHVEHAIGRLHPALVHFPIALILVACLMDVLGWARRRQEPSPTAFSCLFLGALAASLAAGVGWLYAEHDPPGRSVADELFWHRWSGVAVAACAWLAVMFALLRRANDAGWLRNGYRLSLGVAAVCVAGTGHLGGELVYGEDYVLEALQGGAAPSSDLAAVGIDVAAEPVFATHVQPIFEARCIECHGPRKQKGKLRLDDAAAVAEHKVIVPGNAAASELIQLIRLPANHDDIMPASGEPLTYAQVTVLVDWVEAGAPWPGAPWMTDTSAGTDTSHAVGQPPADLLVASTPGAPATGTPGAEVATVHQTETATPVQDTLEQLLAAATSAGGAGLEPTEAPLQTRDAALVSVEPPIPTSEAPVAVEALVPVTPDFATDVLPVFETHCVRCHGLNKQKAGLSMHSAAALFGTPPDQWVVKPGNTAASLLVEFINLPREDLDAMPPEEPFPSAAQIALLNAWVAAGAPVDGRPMTPEFARELSETDAAPVPDVLEATTLDDPLAGPKPFGLPDFTEDADAATEAHLSALRERGAVAKQVALNTDAVEVNLGLLGDAVGDDELLLLDGLQARLVWLDLPRTAVTDAGLAALETFTQLRRLNLSSTAIGNEGLTHLGSLSRLELLNLFDTQVTDAALDALAHLPALKRVYLWQTGVTEEGAKRLAAARPDLTVDIGQPTLPDIPEQDGEPEADADAGTDPINGG